MTEYRDKDGECKALEIYFGSLDTLFKVILTPSTELDNGVVEYRQLGLEYTQQIMNMTEDEILIQFNFTNPL